MNACGKEFVSPFVTGTPSQFVFLTCIVTSTLTVAVIGNRLRDKRDALQKEKIDNKNPTRLNQIDLSLNNCHNALTQISFVLWIQIIIAIATSLKILTSSLLFDKFMIIGAFYIFGILWPIYFYNHGGGKDLFRPFKK